MNDDRIIIGINDAAIYITLQNIETNEIKWSNLKIGIAQRCDEAFDIMTTINVVSSEDLFNLSRRLHNLGEELKQREFNK